MCWLSGSLTCRLPNVMRSPPARRSLVSSIIVDWFLAPRRWGFKLKSNSTNYPDYGHHGDPPPHKENPHGRAGNRTRDLVISSQKLWPLDHEAESNMCTTNQRVIRSAFRYKAALETTSHSCQLTVRVKLVSSTELFITRTSSTKMLCVHTGRYLVTLLVFLTLKDGAIC